MESEETSKPLERPVEGKPFQADINASRKVAAAARKRTFVRAIEEWGTVKKACEITKVTRGTYKEWHARDWEFAGAVSEARFSFAESLEGLALERVTNPDKNRGSDVLLLGLLNANMPQKYRPQISMNEDSARELIIEWRKASQVVKKDVPVEEKELSAPVEQTLAEILTRRGNVPEKNEGR
jgi:hypothetical protein|tara:strand:- start:956 stop:1501 length:546 start_codon:yes stop_codon:yes gene_type:complete